jgi:adenylate cyclase
LREASDVGIVTALPHETYRFSHALIHNALCDELKPLDRAALHLKIGKTIEELSQLDGGAHDAVLAHHFREGGNTDKAITYSIRSGEAALKVFAYEDAVTHLTQALELIGESHGSPEQELKLQLVLASALGVSAGWASEERVRVLERARQLCQRIGEKKEVFPVLWHLCQADLNGCRVKSALELADRSMRIAGRCGDPTLILLAHYNLCEGNYRAGNFPVSRTHAIRALELYHPAQHALFAASYGIDISVVSRGYVSWNDIQLGSFRQAIETARLNLEYARTLNDPYTLATALLFLSWTHLWRGEGGPGRQAAQEMMTLCTEYGFTEWVGVARGTLGRARTLEGKSQEAIPELLGSLAEVQAAGMLYPSSFFTSLAQAYLEAGLAGEAVRAAEEGIRMIAKSGEQGFEGELLLARGRALLSLGSDAEGVDCILSAVHLAKQQASKWVELRATMTLASTLAANGRRDDAHSMLAEVYQGFTEGFDTADLRDAKVLLDKLGL